MAEGSFTPLIIRTSSASLLSPISAFGNLRQSHQRFFQSQRNNGLECRICDETFTLQGEKVPRLLFCGHSVCHACLCNIHTDGSLVCCPFDRTPTEIGDSGIWGLKKNFALLELLERIENEKCLSPQESSKDEEDANVTKCEEDDTHIANLYCTVCLTNLCTECAKSIHSSKTLAQHCLVPLSEKPKINPPCGLHQSHVLEFACLEESCCDNPLMCYICKDYGAHKGHKHVLIELEADTIRKSILNAVQHVKVFSGEVAEFVKKLSNTTESIEGGLTIDPRSPSSRTPITRQTGTAEKARLNVRQYFNDLRETIQQQESEALLVINTYVREKLQSLRQQQEDMAVLISQVSNVCSQCDRALKRSDAEVIQARSDIVKLLDTVQRQQQLFTDLYELCKEDPHIPFVFTKDNRVHIGQKMEMRVVALGLDNGGKTSILFKLKQNEFVPTITTIGFNVETIEHQSIKFTIWDVGGVQKLRPLWRHYYLNTQAVIFVIDSTNSERLTEAHDELAKLLAEKRLEDALILIYANKQDLSTAVSMETLSERIGIHRLCSGRTWTMIPCSAHTGNGLQEGLDWLANQFLSEFSS